MRRYAFGSLSWSVALPLAVALGAAAGELTVSDHGVGTQVVDRELGGRAERFAEGTQVWFWTRVVGGAPGDGIRHVWLQEGEERLNVELGVDGSPWRTYSSKKLHPGSAGNWTVEARTRDGQVLARGTFTCDSGSAAPAKAVEGG